LEQSQNNSKLDLSCTQSIEDDGEDDKSGDDDAEPDLDINIDDVAIGTKVPAAKKKAVTESVERTEPEAVDAKLNGELSGDNKDSAEAAN